jgi:hypothetical protein
MFFLEEHLSQEGGGAFAAFKLAPTAHTMQRQSRYIEARKKKKLGAKAICGPFLANFKSPWLLRREKANSKAKLDVLLSKRQPRKQRRLECTFIA